MSVEIVVSANFRRKAKKYIKKFSSLKDELADSSDKSLRGCRSSFCLVVFFSLPSRTGCASWPLGIIFQ